MKTKSVINTLLIGFIMGSIPLASAADLKVQAVAPAAVSGAPMATNNLEMAQMKQDMTALKNELVTLKNTMPARTAGAPAIDNSKLQFDTEKQINDLKKQVADLKIALDDVTKKYNNSMTIIQAHDDDHDAKIKTLMTTVTANSKDITDQHAQEQSDIGVIRDKIYNLKQEMISYVNQALSHTVKKSE